MNHDRTLRANARFSLIFMIMLSSHFLGALSLCQDEPSEPPNIEPISGSTHKICQMTGEEDRQFQSLVPNQTLSRFGLWGTDLGASFEHQGRLWFLFGDSIPTGQGTPNPACGDAIAWSTDTNAADCLALTFVTWPDGTFRSPQIPGVDLGCFNVPLDGVSRGETMFVWFSTDTMTRSVLARSNDGAQTFSLVHILSDRFFVNVSADVVAGGQIKGLPYESGDQVLLFGSGLYRDSNVYLATAPLSQIENRNALRFYAGLSGENDTPIWSSEEADAQPLFEQACVGELSAHDNKALNAWILLYNCDEPRGINVRGAWTPWGPWSEPKVAFDPWNDNGYCEFIHVNWNYEVCDEVNDPGREYEWGGEYGPYIITRATQSGAQGILLSFIMSTWNPYNTVLIQTEIAITET